MPRFKELSVQSVWQLVKDVEDLIVFLPDYSDSQMSDREYMYSILASERYEVLKNMIDNARNNRARKYQEKNSDVVYIKKDLYKKIESVKTGKIK